MNKDPEDLPCFVCKGTAKWLYMPSSNNITDEERWRCDDHVPRGCSCNDEPIDGDYSNPDPSNWKSPTDSQGRKFPCIEWFQLDSEFVEVTPQTR